MKIGKNIIIKFVFGTNKVFLVIYRRPIKFTDLYIIILYFTLYFVMTVPHEQVNKIATTKMSFIAVHLQTNYCLDRRIRLYFHRRYQSVEILWHNFCDTLSDIIVKKWLNFGLVINISTDYFFYRQGKNEKVNITWNSISNESAKKFWYGIETPHCLS